MKTQKVIKTIGLQESLVEAERILIAIKSAMKIDKKLLSDDMNQISIKLLIILKII